MSKIQKQRRDYVNFDGYIGNFLYEECPRHIIFYQELLVSQGQAPAASERQMVASPTPPMYAPQPAGCLGTNIFPKVFMKNSREVCISRRIDPRSVFSSGLLVFLAITDKICKRTDITMLHFTQEYFKVSISTVCESEEWELLLWPTNDGYGRWKNRKRPPTVIGI
uniref:OSJNBb0033P05.1 protein n=1 Tax=Oryza sativa subsp. japonica TaxID=39947 RepID=Q7F8Z8_ORYSJ|nr:OSJNBb0033P05.1 [Oryza sativa Japonica Group]